MHRQRRSRLQYTICYPVQLAKRIRLQVESIQILPALHLQPMSPQQILITVLQLFAPRDHHLFQLNLAGSDQVVNTLAGDTRPPDVQNLKILCLSHKADDPVVSYVHAA